MSESLNAERRKWLRNIPLLGLVVLSTSAAAVELLQDDRRVSTCIDGVCTNTVPDSPFADFDVLGQTSSVNMDGFVGSGSGIREGNDDSRGSTFDIRFSVSEPTLITLSGFFQAVDEVPPNVRVSVSLFDDRPIFSDLLVAEATATETAFAYEGALGSGEYRLLLQISVFANGPASAAWDFAATFAPSTELDSDLDHVFDSVDNCPTVANTSQHDGDGDGFGGLCDADINGDCIVNVLDLGIFRSVFNTGGPIGDFNGDGFINFVDLGILRSRYFQAPGPSAFASCDSR